MKARQIIVELTPLLDVILIMLFVLLVFSKSQVDASSSAAEQAKADTESLRQELADTQNALSELRRHERTLDVVDEKSLLLTISMQDGNIRRVRVEDESGKESFLALDSLRRKDAAYRLHDLLLNRILEWENESVFLVFQYDRNSVYHAEYDLISGVIMELKPELAEQGYHLNLIELDLIEPDTQKGE
jgi:hypothetical protein